MVNRLAKLGKSTYVPAVYGSPGMAAYCIETDGPPKQSSSRSKSGFSSYSSSSNKGAPTTVEVITVVDPFTGQVTEQVVQIYGGNASQTSSSDGLSGSGGNSKTIECFPAVPAVAGTAARVVQEGINGWNGGGSSIAVLAGDILASFKVPLRPVAVVVGLSANDESAGFNEATHALYVHGDSIDIIEKGMFVASFEAVDLVAGPTFYILRRGPTVTYHLQAQTYRSTVQSSGAVVLDASLYSTGDYIDDPVFTTLTTGNMPSVRQVGEFSWELPSLDAIFGTAYAQLTLSLPALTSDIEADQSGANGFSWALPRLDAILGVAYAQLELVIPNPALSLEGGFPVVESAGFNWILPQLQLGAVMKTGGLVSFDWTLPSLGWLLSDRPYAALNAKLPAFWAYMDDGPPSGSYGVLESLRLIDFVHMQPVVFLVVYDGVELGDIASIVMLFDGTAYDSLLLGETATPSMIIEAMVRDGLSIGDSIATDREALQYAVNIATGAISTYRNFDFLGFAKTGSATYGYRPDGLYLLGAASDDGELLEALLDVGNIDPGAHGRQRMQGAYLGLSTDGDAFLRLVGDDGQEWLYEIDQRKATAHAKFGRGLESREWRVSLHLVDATTVDLQSIEFLVYTAARRKR